MSTMSLAVEAITKAVTDAGLALADVDGLATHGVGDSTPPNILAPVLGLADLPFYLDQWGGGSVSHAVVGHAAMAVATGMANCVVCYRALNARSGTRISANDSTSSFAGVETPFKEPYGCVTAAHEFALRARAHMSAYGTTHEQLGMISVTQRRHAALNERAVMRKPITLADYLGSRWIAEPFRLLDCCLETDGACAVVVTSKARARHLRHRPAYIGGAVWGGGQTLYSNTLRDLTSTVVATHTAPRLYAMAGIGPADVDVAELYDCFTYSVLVQLEDYGFCAKGEGGPFIESGATALHGSLPVNTHGGSLSEGYVHGINHIAEAVAQLRGDCGPRQVPGAEVALSTGQPGLQSGYTSALVLHV